MTNGPNLYAKQLRLKLIVSFGSVCQEKDCQESDPKKLQFAHIKKTKILKVTRGRGRKERLYDVKKNPKSYILFCKSHHKQFDELREAYLDNLPKSKTWELIELKDRDNIKDLLEKWKSV